MKSLVNTFNKFTTVEIFLILSDIISFIFQNIYKTIKKYVLDPVFDPYLPKEKLDEMTFTLPFFNKSEIKYGHLLIEISKQFLLIYLTYIIYKCVRGSRNQKI